MTEAIALSRPLDALRTAARRIQHRAAGTARAYPRETSGVALFGLAIAGMIATTLAGPNSRAAPTVAPPAPPPLILKQIAPAQAIRLNAEIPVAGEPNPIATPFLFKGGAADRAQALNCLASAVYYEAGNQDADGQRAVAQVVLNRLRHPAFPASVCAVVYQGSTRPTGCQFTFACDGSLNRQPDADGWKRAIEIAGAALAGTVFAPVGWATHYHADYVVPYWASTMAKNAVIGAHLFYRWPGNWGQPGVFAKVYAGREPSAMALKMAALATVHIAPNQPGSLASAIKDIPGAVPLKLNPSLRGDKRLAVRFNLAARKAADTATHQDYSKTFAVSDNLKWSLSGDTTAADQAPLGKSITAMGASGASSSR